MKILILILISTCTFAQLPGTGSLSIKNAAGAGRSISQEVDGNEVGNKSLTTLSVTAGKTAPHSMTEFFGYTHIQVPGAPQSPSAVNNAPSGINISWSAPVTGGAVVTYNIHRNEEGTGYNYLATVDVSVTSYNDPNANLTSTLTYTYRIEACNTAGCGDLSAETNQIIY